MDTVSCAGCGIEIEFKKKPRMGTLVTCAECGAELEVVWLDPLELDWPFIDDLDDDDYEEYEEDEQVYYYDEEY